MKKKIGRNPKCDRDWIKRELKKKWKRIEKENWKKIEKKCLNRKLKKNVQRKQGNKCPKRIWKK